MDVHDVWVFLSQNAVKWPTNGSYSFIIRPTAEIFPHGTFSHRIAMSVLKAAMKRFLTKLLPIRVRVRVRVRSGYEALSNKDPSPF